MINYKIINGNKVAIVESDEILISNVQDALDFMVDIQYNDCNLIVIKSINFIPAFFDLKTKILGDVFQKFVNYQMKLVIIGDFSIYNSKSLNDFIYESNKQGYFLFLKNLTELDNI